MVDMLENQNQLMTFYLGQDLYGIEVMQIQEVTGALPVEKVPLAPNFIKGLINLRGQIATALDLKELFGVKRGQSSDSEQNAKASVVCQLNGNLVSLLVDSLGDVVETRKDLEEPAPETLPLEVKKFLKSICKKENQLLSIIDLNKLNSELNLNNEKIRGDQ